MISKIEQIGVAANIKNCLVLRLLFDRWMLWIRFVDNVELAWIN